MDATAEGSAVASAAAAACVFGSDAGAGAVAGADAGDKVEVGAGASTCNEEDAMAFEDIKALDVVVTAM